MLKFKPAGEYVRQCDLKLPKKLEQSLGAQLWIDRTTRL